MSKYTVFFTQDLPLDMGTAAYHLAYVHADSPDAAATKCKGALGGYATILLVFEGHAKPLIEHESVFTKAKFKIALEKERAETAAKHAADPKNPAYFPLPTHRLDGTPIKTDDDSEEW